MHHCMQLGYRPRVFGGPRGHTLPLHIIPEPTLSWTFAFDLGKPEHTNGTPRTVYNACKNRLKRIKKVLNLGKNTCSQNTLIWPGNEFSKQWPLENANMFVKCFQETSHGIHSFPLLGRWFPSSVEAGSYTIFTPLPSSQSHQVCLLHHVWCQREEMKIFRDIQMKSQVSPSNPQLVRPACPPLQFLRLLSTPALEHLSWK